MTAKQPSYGPWIDWPGRSKKCPLPACTRHQVRFRDGRQAYETRPEGWTWKHDGSTSDIVAYRVAK